MNARETLDVQEVVTLRKWLSGRIELTEKALAECIETVLGERDAYIKAAAAWEDRTTQALRSRDEAQAEAKRLRTKRQTAEQHDCMFIEEELAWTKAERDRLEELLTEVNRVNDQRVAELEAERDRLEKELRKHLDECDPFKMRAADALADAVAVLVQRRLLDERSPAADALLDYRNPPRDERIDRMAVLEALVGELVKALETIKRRLEEGYAPEMPWSNEEMALGIVREESEAALARAREAQGEPKGLRSSETPALCSRCDQPMGRCMCEEPGSRKGEKDG